MKLKLLLALGLAFSAATSSKALAQTPAINWSGFYFGGNVGYGWGSADISQSGAAASFSGVPTVYVPNNFVVGTSNGNAALDGAVGGFQIGYNFASPRWIIGAEADLQFGRRSGSNALVKSAPRHGVQHRQSRHRTMRYGSALSKRSRWPDLDDAGELDRMVRDGARTSRLSGDRPICWCSARAASPMDG